MHALDVKAFALFRAWADKLPTEEEARAHWDNELSMADHGEWRRRVLAYEELTAREDDDAFTCEGCGKVIAPGGKYTTTLDGCYLCEEDAPSFQDCADHWSDRDPAEFDEDEAEAAASCKQALADHVAAGGSPDDKPLTVME
jgi:hypothetical protein